MPTKIINGMSGPDLIQVSDSHDPSLQFDTVVYGDGGSDTIYAGAGNDWIWGQAGDNSNAYFYGGPGDDVLEALGNGHNLLQAGSGNSILISRGINDTLIGGAGNDQLWGTGFQETLEAGSGNNLLVGGDNSVLTAAGENGQDILIGWGLQDTLIAGTGDDQLWGFASQDTLEAGSGNDLLFCQGFNSALSAAGQGGQDTLIAAGGYDTLIAGTGDDQLWARNAHNTLTAGSGNDLLVGRDGADTLNAADQVGQDTLIAGGGLDTLIGGNGNDQLWTLFGGGHLDGGFGSDTLVAGHISVLDGGRHDYAADVLIATATEGETFVTSGDSKSDGYGQVDVAWNFALGTDTIQLALGDWNGSAADQTFGATYYGAFPSAFGPLGGTLLWHGAGPTEPIIFLAGVNDSIAQLQPALTFGSN